MEAKNFSPLSDTALIKPSLLSINEANKLGQGGFGVVYRGKYRGLDAAIKQLLVQDFSPKVQQEFYSEAQVMLQLRDPSVVHLYGITQNPYRMVMEFCWLGSLTNYLQNPAIDISWAVRFHLGTGIASGLHYLHTFKPMIIHGDLKSLNVLLVGDREYPNPKLADFGLARLKTESQSKSKASGGASQGLTIHWAAPELFSLKPTKTPASDIYAFGMTLWEIASRTYPYEGCDQSIVRLEVKEGNRAEMPEGTPDSFANIIQICWDQDPKKRPSAEQVLQALQQAAEKEANTPTNQAGSSTAAYPTGFVNSLNTPLEKTQKQPSPDPQYPTQAAPYQPIFQPEPKKVLSISEQVEQMSTTTKEQKKIRQDEVQALLKWVTDGHLVEVETLLKKNPSLGVCTGTVTDRSDRTFKNITALQYAAWSLDREMCDLIMSYVGTHNSAIQLKALYAKPGRYSVYGDHYDIKSLIAKMEMYLENWSKWNDNQCCQYWAKEIGGEQRKCPAWLVYAWSEEGTDVAWTKQDFTRKIQREYDKNRLDWWFTQNYNNGRGTGSTWAVIRGKDNNRIYDTADTRCWDYINKEISAMIAGQDHSCQRLIDNLGDEQLSKLKSLSETYVTTQAIPVPMKK